VHLCLRERIICQILKSKNPHIPGNSELQTLLKEDEPIPVCWGKTGRFSCFKRWGKLTKNRSNLSKKRPADAREYTAVYTVQACCTFGCQILAIGCDPKMPIEILPFSPVVPSPLSNFPRKRLASSGFKALFEVAISVNSRIWTIGHYDRWLPIISVIRICLRSEGQIFEPQECTYSISMDRNAPKRRKATQGSLSGFLGVSEPEPEPVVKQTSKEDAAPRKFSESWLRIPRFSSWLTRRASLALGHNDRRLSNFSVIVANNRSK
jgi:hypothetical protein